MCFLLYHVVETLSVISKVCQLLLCLSDCFVFIDILSFSSYLFQIVLGIDLEMDVFMNAIAKMALVIKMASANMVVTLAGLVRIVKNVSVLFLFWLEVSFLNIIINSKNTICPYQSSVLASPFDSIQSTCNQTVGYDIICIVIHCKQYNTYLNTSNRKYSN